jgi:hypothetical protein
MYAVSSNVCRVICLALCTPCDPPRTPHAHLQAIDREVEFQAAASNQAKVSQDFDPTTEMTGQQKLAMHKVCDAVLFHRGCSLT